ncbi:MAG: indolepyruvate oxidoreductase subunit beta [Acetatifactor sp.]
MNKDILLCGVGGQGTVLASKLIAAAAMAEGNTVHSAETIGMAQRGGSVTSHIRIGDNAGSPLIPLGNADIMIAFEPAEAVRNLGYLKPEGMVIVNTLPVRPTTESLHPTGYDGVEMVEYLRKKCTCITVNANELCAPLGSSRFFNVAVLGVLLASKRLDIDGETMRNEIRKRVPERFVESNLKAFEIGGTCSCN